MSKLENHQLKLKKICSITLIVEEYLPDEVAIEAPFFGKNVQSMLKLGEQSGYGSSIDERSTNFGIFTAEGKAAITGMEVRVRNK